MERAFGFVGSFKALGSAVKRKKAKAKPSSLLWLLLAFFLAWVWPLPPAFFFFSMNLGSLFVVMIIIFIDIRCGFPEQDDFNFPTRRGGDLRPGSWYVFYHFTITGGS